MYGSNPHLKDRAFEFIEKKFAESDSNSERKHSHKHKTKSEHGKSKREKKHDRTQADEYDERNECRKRSEEKDQKGRKEPRKRDVGHLKLIAPTGSYADFFSLGLVFVKLPILGLLLDHSLQSFLLQTLHLSISSVNRLKLDGVSITRACVSVNQFEKPRNLQGNRNTAKIHQLITSLHGFKFKATVESRRRGRDLLYHADDTSSV